MKATCAIGAGLLAAMLSACAVPETDRADGSANQSGGTGESGQPAMPNAAVTSHRWATRLRPGETVRISNHYGDIRVKSSADSGLAYAGTVQKLRGELRDPEFTTDKTAGGLALGVQVPDEWQGRVDAGVRVPPGAPLVLRTGSGLIEVRTGGNDVDAASEDGPIQLRTGGKIVANTNAGMIRATFQNETYAGAAGSLETVSGAIEVWIHPDAALVISVSGQLTSNLPDAITHVRNSNNGAVIVELGEGGAPLSVKSASGTISVNAFPVPVISGE